MGQERKPGQRRAARAQDGAAPSRGSVYHARNPRASPLWHCAQRHSKELREAGRFQRAVEERSPPLGPASWPRYANLPLTYHPVPDIA